MRENIQKLYLANIILVHKNSKIILIDLSYLFSITHGTIIQSHCKLQVYYMSIKNSFNVI